MLELTIRRLHALIMMGSVRDAVEIVDRCVPLADALLLKLLHERTKVPIAVYIREGIDMVLKHYEHVLPGQMSLEAAGTKKS